MTSPFHTAVDGFSFERQRHLQHVRVEHGGNAVRLWADRSAAEVAPRLLGEIRTRMQELRPDIREREHRRTQLDETLAGQRSRIRLCEIDARQAADRGGVTEGTLDVELRALELEIEEWTKGRAEARARRGWPELSDEERAAYDRYIEEADAAMKPLIGMR